MKSYIYKKSHYLIQHTIPGIFTLLIGLYCLIRQVMTGFAGLLMFVLIICIYNVWNEFVSLSNPYEFDLGEETITFRGYNKEHTYKISEMAAFSMRMVAGNTKIYMNIDKGGLLKGRYWIRVSEFDDDKDIIDYFYDLDEQVNPHSVITKAERDWFRKRNEFRRKNMLVTLKELLDQAKVEHKAVGAFNGTTLEAIRGIIQAAEELNAPVILQHAQSHDDLIDLEEIGPVMKYYAERAKVPVALHLDHGSSFERCVQALRLGFTSVMYDASAKSFEENAAETAEIVKIAHAVGASVEAELGHIFTSEVVQGEGAGADSTDDYEDLDNIYTDPEVAKKFVEMTNVDCLAVAFGTTHGVYLTEPKLDLPRVARLREATNIPLVMHGGSGVSDEDYAVAIENGICKVNYYTYMNTAGGKASKEYWADDSKPLFYDSMSLVATEAIKEDVKRAIKVFQKIK